MDDRAIGIFDSGLGGLTTAKALREILPGEHLVYFGDTGRVPYGTRSKEAIYKYTMQDIRFLETHDVKLILLACNTASSVITPQMRAQVRVPFSGVILPAAVAACKASKTGKIGVIGTPATIKSGEYVRHILDIRPDAQITQNACTLFVPLVENGFIQPDNEVAITVAKQYLRPIIEAEVDVLILGCTHYPLLYQIIDDILEHQVTLIDSGREGALWAKDYLAANDMLRSGARDGNISFYVSDSPEGFSDVGSTFLGNDIHGNVTQIDIDSL